MKSKRYLIFILAIGFVLICHSSSIAQCAMCKTGVESDLKTGGSIGSNLNMGILYLMAIPYVALIGGGYFFFRKQINAKIKEWKNKYFPAKQEN